MPMPKLIWLPEQADWAERVNQLERAQAVKSANLVAFANTRLDFLRTERLDRLMRRHFANEPLGLSNTPVRLAILASSTSPHLVAVIRAAALRRNIWLTTYGAEYGQYLQELMDVGSALHVFRPTIVLLAVDAHQLTAGIDPADDATTAEAAIDLFPICFFIACRGKAGRVIFYTLLERKQS